MTPWTTRKHIKKLVRELLELQLFDIPMTPATLVKSKYLLRKTKHCAQVEIKSDPSDGSVDGSAFEVERHVIPKFILSQLEDQGLTDTSSPQVALTAALSFITFSLPAHLVEGSCYPVLFRWQQPVTHRTHVIFAYVDMPMASNVYTIQELLSLRDSYKSDGLVSVLDKDRELAEVLRGPVNRCGDPVQRSTRRTKEDSSTESDEVVFKGNGKRRAAQSSTQPRTQPAPIHPTPDQPDMEWRYRGRTESEMAASEPLSAPPGLNAQQNEGFQRFYKAVVSPTHVRVTAGGRIVPNTRGTSPTTKRAKYNDVSSTAQAGETKSTPAAKDGTPMLAMPPMHPYVAGFHPGFPSYPQPFGMVPVPLGPNGLPLTPMPFPGYPKPKSSAESTLKEAHKKTEDSQLPDMPKSENTKAEVKISPPEQFDPTKPFFYNGQWMYPAQAPIPPAFGRGMAPLPGFGGHFPAPMMVPPPMGVPMMLNPFAMPPPSQATPGLSRAVSHGQLAHSSSNNPPISSIRPSDISKKQMESLRGNLKYHEDQLQYNRHQIDEKDMENKIQLLKNDIERFERVYHAQLDFETKHYPKADNSTEEKSVSSTHSAKADQLTSSEVESTQNPAPTHVDTKSLPQRAKEPSRPKIGPHATLRAQLSHDLVKSKRISSSNDLAKKSGFPSDIALAPPFQPRSSSAFLVGGNGFANFRDPAYTKKQLDDSHQRLLAAGANAWKGVSENKVADPKHSGQADSAQEPRATTKPLSDAEDHEEFGVPYLVGTLPRGINLDAARETDYTYARELTDDERRSRYLYWGKAPPSIRRGLPKFDGKDFYPPSPTKEVLSDSDSPSIRARRLPVKKESAKPSLRGTANGAVPTMSRLPSTNKKSTARRAPSSKNQVDSSSDDFKLALGDTETPGEPKKLRSSKAGKSVNKSTESLERRSADQSAKLWRSMLKRGVTSGDVLPSEVSSTTAQGVLPQYTGHAAASLSPTIAHSGRRSPSKAAEDSPVEGAFLKPVSVTEKRTENMPPVGPGSLEDNFRNIVSMDAKNRSVLSASWNALK